jgi:hypothetical protein
MTLHEELEYVRQERLEAAQNERAILRREFWERVVIQHTNNYISAQQPFVFADAALKAWDERFGEPKVEPAPAEPEAPNAPIQPVEPPAAAKAMDPVEEILRANGWNAPKGEKVL